VHAQPDADIVGHQVRVDLRHRSQFRELRQDQADDGPDLLVRVEGDATVGLLDVPDRDAGEQSPAAGLVQPAVVHPGLEDVEFGLAHRSFESEEEAVVELGRVIHPVGVGQQDVKQAAQLEELVLVDHQDAGFGPAELDGPADELVLEVGRLAVLGNLVRGGLADIHDGPLVAMSRGNLVGGAVDVSGIHRWPPDGRPPVRRAGWQASERVRGAVPRGGPAGAGPTGRWGAGWSGAGGSGDGSGHGADPP